MIALVWLTQSYQLWVTTVYIHLCEAPECFQGLCAPTQVRGTPCFPLHMQNPTPLQPDFPRIVQATSLLSWNQLQSPLCTTVTTLKCCTWNWRSKVCWAGAQELSVSVHKDKWLLNNSIHNMESMKYGKEKTARVQFSIATPWKGQNLSLSCA